MLIWLRRIFVFAFLLLAVRYRAYLLDTESQLLYGLVPLFLASFFLVEKPTRAFRLSDGALLGFLFFFALSCGFAQQPFGFFEFTTFFVGALVYYAVRFLKIPSSPSKYFAWRELFVTLGSAFSVFALVHFSLAPTDRLSGLFHGYEAYTFYPNAAALLLLAILPFNVELALNKQRFYYGLLMLNTSAFLLTFSRGAYLVALALAVFSALFYVRKIFTLKGVKKLSFLCASGALAFGLAFGVNALKADSLVVSERLLLKDDAGLVSVSERVGFWKGAWQMSLDHPWTGVGPGGFEPFYPAYQENWLAISSHPHNIFLKISSESGVPAMLFFGGFVALILLLTLKRLGGKNTDGELALFVSASALLLHNLIDYNLNFTLLSALVFVLLAVLENGNEDEVEKSRQDLARSQTGLYFLSGLCLAVSFLVLWQGAGLMQMRQMEAMHDSDPQSEVLEQYLENPPTLPFEMGLFEMQAALALDLGKEEALEALLERFDSYSDYHRWIYFKARMDSGFAGQLLQANSKNEMEYWVLFYASRPTTVEDISEMETLVRNYSSLLSRNEHMTVLSQNPKFTEELCASYSDTEILGVEDLLEACSIFDWIWSAELYKFNQRYGTDLDRGAL